jgi:hypothetical protein
MGVRETDQINGFRAGIGANTFELLLVFPPVFPLPTPSLTPLRKAEAGETNWVPTDPNRRFELPGANVSEPPPRRSGRSMRPTRACD